MLWSVANETPVTPARVEFLKALVTKTHEQDPTRLVTAALLVRTEGMTKIIDDPLGEVLDVIDSSLKSGLSFDIFPKSEISAGTPIGFA